MSMNRLVTKNTKSFCTLTLFSSSLPNSRSCARVSTWKMNLYNLASLPVRPDVFMYYGDLLQCLKITTTKTTIFSYLFI